MLPQSYVGDAKLGVHPQWHIAEKKIYKGRWAAGRRQWSGPRAAKWPAGWGSRAAFSKTQSSRQQNVWVFRRMLFKLMNPAPGDLQGY